jgi:hypothetical protein
MFLAYRELAGVLRICWHVSTPIADHWGEAKWRIVYRTVLNFPPNADLGLRARGWISTGKR